MDITSEEKQKDEYIKNLLVLIDNKNKRLVELFSFLRDHEQWEADFISDNSMWWPHGKNGDVLKGKLYESFLELQSKRNSLLNKVIQAIMPISEQNPERSVARDDA